MSCITMKAIKKDFFIFSIQALDLIPFVPLTMIELISYLFQREINQILPTCGSELANWMYEVRLLVVCVSCYVSNVALLLFYYLTLLLGKFCNKSLWADQDIPCTISSACPPTFRKAILLLPSSIKFKTCCILQLWWD